jgi:hypothetical protein
MEIDFHQFIKYFVSTLLLALKFTGRNYMYISMPVEAIIV